MITFVQDNKARDSCGRWRSRRHNRCGRRSNLGAVGTCGAVGSSDGRRLTITSSCSQCCFRMTKLTLRNEENRASLFRVLRRLEIGSAFKPMPRILLHPHGVIFMWHITVPSVPSPCSIRTSDDGIGRCHHGS